MPVVRYPYRIVLGKGALQPICTIKVYGWNQQVETLDVLIDSGATYTVFPAKTAENLGIKLSAGDDCLIQYGGSETTGKKIDTVIEIGD